jgi:molecular chaperone DnaJ
MTAAALGATLQFETLDGHEEINVRPGTQSGATINLRGLGMPRLRSSGRGELVIHLEIETPTALDDEQRELLAKLAALRGEEKPAGTLHEDNGGLFGKLKDAFTSR